MRPSLKLRAPDVLTTGATGGGGGDVAGDPSSARAAICSMPSRLTATVASGEAEMVARRRAAASDAASLEPNRMAAATDEG